MQEKLSTLLSSDYLSAMVLFILMIILLLAYLTVRYKKILKYQAEELHDKDEKIKSLRQYAYETEVKRVEREHAIEKEILSLNHTIKELETKNKEGLKSQVLRMIESCEKKRAEQLEQASLKR